MFLQNLALVQPSASGWAQRPARRDPRLDLVRHLGLRPGRPYASKKAYDLLVQCEAGLLSVTGTRGDAGEGRHPGGRHRGRHVRLFARSWRRSCAAAGRTGKAPRSTSRCSGIARRMDGLSRLLHRLRRRRPAALGALSRHHRALRPVPRGDGGTGVPRACRTSASSRVLRPGTGETFARRPTSASHPARQGSATARPSTQEIEPVFRASVERDRRAARGRGYRQRPAEQHAEGSGAIRSSSRARALGKGRLAGRNARMLKPPFNLSGFEPRMDPIPAVGEHTRRSSPSSATAKEALEALAASGAI